MVHVIPVDMGDHVVKSSPRNASERKNEQEETTQVENAKEKRDSLKYKKRALILILIFLLLEIGLEGTTKIPTIVYSETGKVLLLLSFEKLMTKWEPAKRVTSHKYLRVWQKLAPGSRGKNDAC